MHTYTHTCVHTYIVYVHSCLALYRVYKLVNACMYIHVYVWEDNWVRNACTSCCNVGRLGLAPLKVRGAILTWYADNRRYYAFN